MALGEELASAVKKIFGDTWSKREGQKVPETDDLQLGNDAITLTGTVLYADLTDSTSLVNRQKAHFAAEIYKAYLRCSAKVIRSLGGTITAYDGDRVMAVFIGDSKNSNAATCGLKINHAARNIVQPAINAQYPKSEFQLRHVVGIDTSELFIARTGIRGSNDLVWVGRAANYAAKMSELPSTYPTYIAADVYNRLNGSAKFGGGDKRNMWTDLGTSQLGMRIYGSKWWSRV